MVALGRERVLDRVNDALGRRHALDRSNVVVGIVTRVMECSTVMLAVEALMRRAPTARGSWHSRWAAFRVGVPYVLCQAAGTDSVAGGW